MIFFKLLLGIKYKDYKIILLYRFHILILIINILAVAVELFSKRYDNVWIELFIVILLSINLWYLYRYQKLLFSAYMFLTILGVSLFYLIYINHFATMSIIFILLLPLTIMLFISIKHSILIEIVMLGIMGLLLYLEYYNNPNNPLFQNHQALFNLGYTALIIYFFGLLYHAYILRTFEELDASNRQKEMLLNEVHHRVKNNLNVIASIIGLQSNRLDGREKEELLKSKTRIESIALVHEMLYGCDNFENIDFYDYTHQLSRLLLSMYQQSSKIKIIINSNGIKLPLEIMIHLGIMTNELLTNSVKYAFNDADGEINITLSCENDKFKFIYCDNGAGVSSSDRLLKSKSLGIKLIQLSARQLNGELLLSSPKGLQYEVEFKNE